MTLICPLISKYEEYVWHYLTDVFNYKLRAAELGFTNDLVYRITKFYGGKPLNCEVYAIHGYNENVRGADIDLFIMNRQIYTHYMIQSKIMNYIGAYLDIEKYNPATIAITQYQILLDAASSESAFPLYLLYNGLTGKSSKGNQNHGCTIIAAKKISDFRFRQHQNAPTQKNIPRISFNDIYGDMFPLHCLFCDNCNTKFELPSGKSMADIYLGYPYKKVFADSNIGSPTDNENEEGLDDSAISIINSRHLAPIRIIIKGQ